MEQALQNRETNTESVWYPEHPHSTNASTDWQSRNKDLEVTVTATLRCPSEWGWSRTARFRFLRQESAVEPECHLHTEGFYQKPAWWRHLLCCHNRASSSDLLTARINTHRLRSNKLVANYSENKHMMPAVPFKRAPPRRSWPGAGNDCAVAAAAAIHKAFLISLSFKN